MSSNKALLEELEKKYLSENPTLGLPDSYDLFKHKNGINNKNSYAAAVSSLFASSKKGSAGYGQNNRVISNKGLQNSGYYDFVNDNAKDAFGRGKNALKSSLSKSEAESLGSYAEYLEKYKDKQNSTKDKVLSHLIDSGIVDLGTSIAYGINAGLSFDDARALGESAYDVTKQKILNEILKQTASLGLDADGAKMLATKMGLSESDAENISKEVSELLEYYRNISTEYLEFLEQRS